MRALVTVVLCAALSSACGEGQPGGESVRGSLDLVGKTPAPACRVARDCAVATDVCVEDRCAPGFGRTYRLSALAASFPAARGDGRSWDLDGAPDPYVCVSVYGSPNGLACSDTRGVRDSLDPAWSGTFEVEVGADTQVIVTAWDADPGSPAGATDDALGGLWWPNGASFVESVRSGALGEIAFPDQRSQWSVTITPR